MECLKCFGNYYILLHTITYASTIVLPGASYQLLPGCGRELLLSQLNQAFWTFHRSRCQDREIIGCKNKEKGAVFNIKSTGGATSFGCHQYSSALLASWATRFVCSKYNESCFLIYTETWLQGDFPDFLMQVGSIWNVCYF